MAIGPNSKRVSLTLPCEIAERWSAKEMADAIAALHYASLVGVGGRPIAWPANTPQEIVHAAFGCGDSARIQAVLDSAVSLS